MSSHPSFVQKKKLLPRPKPKKKPVPEATVTSSTDATQRDDVGDVKADLDRLQVHTEGANASGEDTDAGAGSEREEESVTAGGD